MNNKQKENKNLKFPKSIFIIIAFQFCLKFAYNALRSVLPLYIVDALHYEENEAMVFYHTFSMFLFLFSMIGGMLTDSWLGKFRSLIYFSIFFVIGLILLSVSSISSMHLPVREFTILGLIIAAFGYGAARPCVPAFGGDQFVLPQQTKQLTLLFLLLCAATNVGSLTSGFITPVLRKDLMCFGQLTCYPIVFIVPAGLMIFSAGVIIVSKRYYKINKPESNVVLEVTKCVFHAIYQRIKTCKQRPHWLDHASDRYDRQLIADIKSVSKILYLFLPLPVFWSLYSMQSSIWTFQATRMDGEVGGYLIKPDQIQAVNPLSVIIFIPVFHAYVYPVLGRFCAIGTPLRKVTLGGLVIALAYFMSGVVEMHLEPTYAKTPVKELAQLRVFNTLDCDVSMTVGGDNFTLERLNMWQNLDIATSGRRILEYQADFKDCNNYKIPSQLVSGGLEVMENQATSWIVADAGIIHNYTDRVDKSMSGNPLVRASLYLDDTVSEPNAVLSLVYDGDVISSVNVPKDFKETDFIEVAHKTYDLYLNDRLVEQNVALKLGGVYTIVGRISSLSSTTAIRAVTVTEPNSLHILWILPQQILLSISEIMVDVMMMEFAFSQSPVSMKALLQSCWLFTAFFGNLMVILITELNLFERKVYVFFFYGTLMTVSMILFAIIATFYKYKDISELQNPQRTPSTVSKMIVEAWNHAE